MDDNRSMTENEEIYDDQVLITGITWNTKNANSYSGKKTSHDVDALPSQFTLNIPENVLKQANQPKNRFNDVIETFVYNFLTHKFGYEVSSCSIWLPLEDK